MSQTISLQGQGALVTGGSSGIGAGVAIALAAAGAKVVVNYAHSAKGAEETVGKISALGGEAIASCHFRGLRYLEQYFFSESFF